MNSGFFKFQDFLEKYDKFVVSTHESPDADGLGAEIAFVELLRKLGKTVMVLNSDPVPEICQFMDIDSELTFLSDDTILPIDIKEYAQFVLDTNDYDNIGRVYHLLSPYICETFIIDHHEGTSDIIRDNFIKVEASSACEIIYDIYTHYDTNLSFKAAQALFAGIVFDTGSFKYSKTSSHTFSIASHLVDIGANPVEVHKNLYESNAIESFSLRSMIISTMKSYHDGRVVVMSLTSDMVERSGAVFAEGESVINEPMVVKSVVVSVLIKQDVGGPVKISMRTKGDLDVAKIAMKNGGGGHKNAAGFRIHDLPFKDAYVFAMSEIDTLFE